MKERSNPARVGHLSVLAASLCFLTCCDRNESDSSRLSQERESCSRTADCIAPLRCIDRLCTFKADEGAAAPKEVSSTSPANVVAPTPQEPIAVPPRLAPTSGTFDSSASSSIPAPPESVAPTQAPPECNTRRTSPFNVHGEGTKAGTTRYYRKGMTFSEWGSEGGSEAVSFVGTERENLLIRIRVGSSGVVGKIRYRNTEKLLKPSADGSYRFVHQGYSVGESEETLKPQEGKYRIELRGTDCIQVRLLNTIIPYEGE